MLHQWSCQCDGTALKVSLPISLNAEVQVIVVTIEIEAMWCNFYMLFVQRLQIFHIVEVRLVKFIPETAL